MNDSQAIGAVLHGDKDRFEELVDRYKKMVYAIAWSHLGDRELSEDAAQETFVKAFSYLGTLRDPDRFSPWLARIARNVCGSFRRRMSRENAFNKRWAVLESAEPPHEDGREMLEEQLWESFGHLPDVHREALTVFYIQGKSTREAAEALGMTETGFRTRLHRARAALREQLETRLEDRLDTLKPSSQFNRSVMVLLPLSPKGVIGTGGILAILGKFSASFSLALWFALAPLAVMGTIVGLEAANIKNTPENRFRKRFVLGKWLVMFAFTSGLSYATIAMVSHHRLTWTQIFQIQAILTLPFMLLIPKQLQINRSPKAVRGYIIMTSLYVAYAAVAFLHAPLAVLYSAFLIIMVYGLFSREQIHDRGDYSLFHRAAIGGIRDVSPEDLPAPRRFSDLELRSYMRFLGDQAMVRDFSLVPGGLLLKTPGVGSSFVNPFSSMASGSQIMIMKNGDCNASLGNRDLKAIERMTKIEQDKEQLEGRVCRVVRSTLELFINGEWDAAKSVLTTQPDESIYKKPMHKSAYWRVLMIFNIVLWSLALYEIVVRHMKF